MSPSVLALVVTLALVLTFVGHTVAEALNLRALEPEVPEGFRDIYDAESYAKSQAYTRARTGLHWIAGSWDLAVLLAFWHLGGFGYLADFISAHQLGPILTGLGFIAILGLASELISLPFALYSTFVLEERFGFNRTSLSTFCVDRVKGALLAVVLGGLLLSGILAFFEWAGSLAWLYAWIGVSAASLGVSFVAPTWIMPLFNRFTPLEDGELRRAIFDYAERVQYPLSNIFVVDGSKRSAKSNAFFMGFGKNKRIALYDTLVEKHSVDELVGVMAHEIGHYKLAHIRSGMAISVIQFGVLFFLLSLVIQSETLFLAFGLDTPSVYAGIVIFLILYSPVSTLLGIALSGLSRRHEFQADRYAVETTGRAGPLVDALKTGSLTNLGNLTPHPVYVRLTYSHPPLIERIARLREVEAGLVRPTAP